MNEASEMPEGIFGNATIENGVGFVRDVVAAPPAPEPVIVEHLSSAAASAAAGESGNAPTPDASTKVPSSNEADGSKVLHVDKRDYARVTDHKGRPFDPSRHQVDKEGKPIFNARGKVKMLKEGERNPVKLVWRSITERILPDPDAGERDPVECEAQAAVQINEEDMRLNASCVADLYAGTGFIAFGSRFMKGWEKGRRPRLVNALIHYDRQTGKLPTVAPIFVLAHAFATDAAMMAGGEIFDRGGGFMGFLQKMGFFQRFKKSRTKVHAAEPEKVVKEPVQEVWNGPNEDMEVGHYAS